MNWKKITLEEKDVMESFFKYKSSKGCELSFGNNYLWADIYKTFVGFYQDCMLFYNELYHSVSFPIGEKPLEIIPAIEAYFKEQNLPMRLGLVTPEQFAAWAKFAKDAGFTHVASGPLVRSSYHADLLAAGKEDALS